MINWLRVQERAASVSRFYMEKNNPFVWPICMALHHCILCFLRFEQFKVEKRGEEPEMPGDQMQMLPFPHLLLRNWSMSQCHKVWITLVCKLVIEICALCWLAPSPTGWSVYTGRQFAYFPNLLMKLGFQTSPFSLFQLHVGCKICLLEGMCSLMNHSSAKTATQIEEYEFRCECNAINHLDSIS